MTPPLIALGFQRRVPTSLSFIKNMFNVGKGYLYFTIWHRVRHANNTYIHIVAIVHLWPRCLVVSIWQGNLTETQNQLRSKKISRRIIQLNKYSVLELHISTVGIVGVCIGRMIFTRHVSLSTVLCEVYKVGLI